MDAIWIAAVSAIGVIGGALIQGITHSRSNRASIERAAADALARNQQLEIEVRERETIRQEERQEREKLRADEHHATWVNKRQELHEKALAVLNPLVSQAGRAASDVHGSVALRKNRGESSIFTSHIEKFLGSYKTQQHALQDQENWLVLYGSPKSAGAYIEAHKAMGAFASELTVLNRKPFTWGDKPEKQTPYASEDSNKIRAKLLTLKGNLKGYVEAARADLKTN